jgi:hypothetical protein
VSQYSQQSSGRTASVLNFILTITGAIVFFIYISLTAYTKDALWFYPVFEGTPTSAIIYCYGEEKIITYESEHLSALTQLVNEQISGDKRWDQLNLSDQSYLDYQTSKIFMTLALLYDEPQRIHSQSPFFSNFDTLLIPLDGRNADTNILFSLIRNKPSGGSFHVTSFDSVRTYIQENKLCTKP